jgi:hypothetical protein
MTKLGFLALLSVAAAVCACTSAPHEEEEAPTDGPFGDVVVVGVSGRGVVTSDPGSIYCGNDGDQRRCEGEFLFDEGERGRRVTLTAKEYDAWAFREWTFTTEGQIAYEPIDPEIDLKKPTLVFRPGTIEEPSGKVRPRRYRVTAIFEPR